MPKPPYVWVKNVGRYRDTATGRFVPAQMIRDLTQSSIQTSSDISAALAERVVGGTLAPTDWRAVMQNELKGEYIRQYLTGIGGREQMTKSDWGKVGAMLKEQYKYLNGFAKDVAEKNLTPEQVAMRAGMYFNSAREAFEKANAKVQKAQQRDEVAWMLGASEHCEDCLAFAALGWQPVDSDPFGGAVPGSGDTRCLTNCQCSLEYRQSAPSNEEAA